MIYYHHSSDLWPFKHKVTFNGVNKLIYVNAGESIIDVRINLYSDWKEWTKLRDYAKFPPAFRTIGGDPIDAINGVYAGDIYFLTNGWRVVIPHSVTITGVLYTNEGDTPYIIERGAGVSAVVSNLVQTVYKEIPVPVVLPSSVPTASQIATAVRNELNIELAKINSQINGLTSPQQIMLQEIYALYSLDPTKPLIVTDTTRTAGDIHQTIDSNATRTIVTRI